MRKDIAFTSQGLQCSGWLYVPDDLAEGQKAPAIVMANGFTGVKEQIPPDLPEGIVAAGFVTLLFDFRYFGDSEGDPRSQLFPLEQVEDYRNAITWLSDQPEVDPERIGVWGTSFSGGIVLQVGTFDKRVKAVVAQAPSALNAESRRDMNPERFDLAGAFLLQDRIARSKTGAVNYMKVVAPDGEPCIVPGQTAYALFMSTREIAPNWRNEVTLESLEKIREFDPVSLIHLLAPAALLMIPAVKDDLIPVEAVRAAYEQAGQPKAIVELPISHFEIYEEPWLSRAVGAAVDWFEKYL
jgi:uncharacterized protein